MEKVIQIGGIDCRLKSSAAVARLYRLHFERPDHRHESADGRCQGKQGNTAAKEHNDTGTICVCMPQTCGSKSAGYHR